MVCALFLLLASGVKLGCKCFCWLWTVFCSSISPVMVCRKYFLKTNGCTLFYGMLPISFYCNMFYRWVMCGVIGFKIVESKTKSTIAFGLILGLVVLGAMISVESDNWSVVPDIGNGAITILHTIISTAFYSTSPRSTVITTVLQPGWLTEYIKISASPTVVAGATSYAVMTTRVFAYVVSMPFSSFLEDVNRVGSTITELEKQLYVEQRAYVPDRLGRSRRRRKRKYCPKFLRNV